MSKPITFSFSTVLSRQEDIIVCPQLLSTSSNPDYVQKYLSLGASSLEKHVILTISHLAR